MSRISARRSRRRSATGRASAPRLRYSRETEPLEVAGGIATALPLLGDGVVLVVSADVYADYDYATLRARLAAMEATDVAAAPAHGDGAQSRVSSAAAISCSTTARLALDGAPRLTFGNIALYRTSLFRELPRGEKLKILPQYRDWIGRGWASGELFTGRWANVGTPDDLAAARCALLMATDDPPHCDTRP